jgi:hypothetical protein
MLVCETRGHNAPTAFDINRTVKGRGVALMRRDGKPNAT